MCTNFTFTTRLVTSPETGLRNKACLWRLQHANKWTKLEMCNSYGKPKLIFLLESYVLIFLTTSPRFKLKLCSFEAGEKTSTSSCVWETRVLMTNFLNHLVTHSVAHNSRILCNALVYETASVWPKKKHDLLREEMIVQPPPPAGYTQTRANWNLTAVPFFCLSCERPKRAAALSFSLLPSRCKALREPSQPSAPMRVVRRVPEKRRGLYIRLFLAPASEAIFNQYELIACPLVQWERRGARMWAGSTEKWINGQLMETGRARERAMLKTFPISWVFGAMNVIM